MERSAVDYTPEETSAHLRGGLGQGAGSTWAWRRSATTWSTGRATTTVSEFVRGKIREIVTDPAVAELARAQGPPVLHQAAPLWRTATTRPSTATQRDAPGRAGPRPIEEITPHGVRMGGHEYEGPTRSSTPPAFDAMDRHAVRHGNHRPGRAAACRTSGGTGPRTYLGLTTRGFPNLFVITGPQRPVRAWSNMPVGDSSRTWSGSRGSSQHMTAAATWAVAEPAQEAEDKWVGAPRRGRRGPPCLLGTDLLVGRGQHPGQARGRCTRTFGGCWARFRAVLAQEVAEKGYEGLVLDSARCPGPRPRRGG